jgi:hypothetical protein
MPEVAVPVVAVVLLVAVSITLVRRDRRGRVAPHHGFEPR